MGCVVFNDFPQGSFGMVDYKHENYWVLWFKLGLLVEWSFWSQGHKYKLL